MISPRIEPGGNLERRFTPHRKLIASVLFKFFQKWGNGAEPVVVRGFTRFRGHAHREELLRLGISVVDRWELPDIVAYSAKRRWLYLIEAVHSSGPVSPIRHLELRRLTTRCKADIVYVTAFLDRKTFRKFAADISWETEVWIAETPDHLVHFNGDSFIGPHNPKHSCDQL